MKILCLGDWIVDVYHEVTPVKVCPEGPCLAVTEQHVGSEDGAVELVAQNLRHLGHEVTVITDSAPRSVKHRYVVGAQLLLRVDEERKDHPDIPALQARLTDEAKNHQALVLADYHKGTLTRELLAAANFTGLGTFINAHAKGQYSLFGYQLAVVHADDYPSLAGHLKADNLIVTSGSEGLWYKTRAEPGLTHIPATCTHPVSTTGAGNLVLAAATHHLLAGESLRNAALFACHAAGDACEYPGNCLIPPLEKEDT